jgi:hypothetical protein
LETLLSSIFVLGWVYVLVLASLGVRLRVHKLVASLIEQLMLSEWQLKLSKIVVPL